LVKRRTLDLIFSVGAVALSLLLVVLGLVLQNQSNFAKDYVHNQLEAQKITFTPAAGLTAEEKAATCLVDYAGKPLTTGKQAECYANNYIGLHVKSINDGKTYSQTSSEARSMATEATAALAKNPNDAQAKALDAQAKALQGKATTLFQGETLRGLLLTSYGFSIFGERAGQAALVCFLVAAVLLLAAIAGFVHAMTASRNAVVGAQHD
jgi:hypothetical protein